jgi:hypothetical protein
MSADDMPAPGARVNAGKSALRRAGAGQHFG